MNDKLLIELVRRHPAFYDVSHEAYMDKQYKNRIWKNIAKEMKQDALTCRMRWSNIRDNYRKSLKKSKLRSERGLKIKQYKYAQQMRFIRNYFDDDGILKDTPNDRERSPTDSTHMDEPEDNNLSWGDEDNENVKELPSPHREENNQKVNNSDNETPTCSRVHSCQANEDMTHSTKVPNQLADPLYFNLHAVDAFLLGLSSSLKELSPYQWHIAKSELFAIVQKFDVERLIEKQTNE